MIVVLSAIATHAPAQIIVGGNKRPAVSVDNSVLDRLGPPLTLPEFYRGARTPSHVAQPVAAVQRAPSGKAAHTGRHVATRHVATRHAASRKIATQRHHTAPAVRLASATSDSGSSLNRIIHLIPPAKRVAAPATTFASNPTAPVSHDQGAVSAPTKATIAALAAPPSSTHGPSQGSSPSPKQPASPAANETPTPPTVPTPTPRDVVPTPAVAPPSEPVPPPTVTAMATPAAPPAVPPKPSTASTSAAPTPTAPAPSPATSADATPPTRSPLFVRPGTTDGTASAAATPTPPQVAAAPPAVPSPSPPVQMAAATTAGNNASAVKFGAGATDLGKGPQPALDMVAGKLLGNDNLRVQVIAHATGSADEAMEARRVSLARAVAVRAYLIDKGVRSLRIDVRALGNRSDDGPVADQVDLMVVSQ